MELEPSCELHLFITCHDDTLCLADLRPAYVVAAKFPQMVLGAKPHIENPADIETTKIQGVHGPFVLRDCRLWHVIKAVA